MELWKSGPNLIFDALEGSNPYFAAPAIYFYIVIEIIPELFLAIYIT